MLRLCCEPGELRRHVLHEDGHAPGTVGRGFLSAAQAAVADDLFDGVEPLEMHSLSVRSERTNLTTVRSTRSIPSIDGTRIGTETAGSEQRSLDIRNRKDLSGGSWWHAEHRSAVSQVLQGEAHYNLTVRYQNQYRGTPEAIENIRLMRHIFSVRMSAGEATSARSWWCECKQGLSHHHGLQGRTIFLGPH